MTVVEHISPACPVPEVGLASVVTSGGRVQSEPETGDGDTRGCSPVQHGAGTLGHTSESVLFNIQTLSNFGKGQCQDQLILVLVWNKELRTNYDARWISYESVNEMSVIVLSYLYFADIYLLKVRNFRIGLFEVDILYVRSCGDK